MKKAIYLNLIALGAMVLVGCNTSKNNNDSKDSSKKSENVSSETGSQTSSQTSNQTSSQSSSSQQTGPKKTLIYRSWDLGTETQNNEERQLVKAFEEAENVTVKIVENPGTGNFYWDGIKASVVNGIDLADVMMVPNLDWPLASEFLLNIKDIADADEEFAKVTPSVRDACTFKNGIYAVPARMNLQGYFINIDVAESHGLIQGNTILSCSSPYSLIESIVNKAASKPGVVGLDAAAHFIDTMASVLDESGEMGYFTWDGSQYHLDSEAFIQGVQKGKALFEAKKTLDAYDEEEKAALGLDPELDPKVDAWNKGKLALRYGYTYEIPDMLENNTLGNSYQFIGNPGGKITIVGDYYGIYKNTKEPELAYKFAKWMSFGKAGFIKRMELYQAKGSVNSLPLIDDDELIDRYFEMFGDSMYMSGLEDAYDYIQEHSMVEGVKVVPGYLSARQNKKTGIQIGEIENATMFELLNACYCQGEDITQYTSGAVNINTIANQTYTDWMTRYGSKYE